MLNCGRRFGKTQFGIDRLIAPALEGYPVAWFAPSFPFISEVWRELNEVLEPIRKSRNKTEKRIELVTGGIVQVWSLENPDSGRGRKYKRVIVDEAAHARLLEEAWNKSIRATLSDFRGDAYFLSTPKGRNFFWELFQRGNPESEQYDPNWQSWRMPTLTNPFIHPDEIEAARRELPPTVFNQEYLAEFLEVGGRYFVEWRESQHAVLPVPVKPHWKYFGGLDGGTAAPFAFVLCASDEAGTVYVIDEAYQRGLLPEQQAEKVLEVLARYNLKPGSVQIAADPALFPAEDARQRVGKADIEDFHAKGLNCYRANNRRVHGWRTVRGFMHVEGALKVFKGRCTNLIRTIPLMVHDERPLHQEDLDTTLEDHACDALRYALHSTRPKAAVIPETLTASSEAHRQLILPPALRSTRPSEHYE